MGVCRGVRSYSHSNPNPDPDPDPVPDLDPDPDPDPVLNAFKKLRYEPTSNGGWLGLFVYL